MSATRDIKIAKWILILVLAAMAGKALLNWMEEPKVSIDYVSELNILRRPEDSNDSNDGSVAFLKACKVIDNQCFGGRRYLVFNNANGERWFVLDRPLWPGDMNDVEKKNLRAWLADNDQVFRMTEYAMSREHCCFELYARDDDFNYIELQRDITPTRELSEAFFWRAKMKAADGDIAGALQDVMLVADMSRHFVNYPYGPEWWIGARLVEDSCWVALEMAARTTLTDGQLAAIAAHIEQNGQAFYTIGTSLESERFRIYDMVQRFYSDDGHGDGRLLAGHGYRYSISRATYRRSLRDKPGLMLDSLGVAYSTDGRKETLARWDRMVEKAATLSELPLWELRGRRAADLNSLETEAKGNTMLESGGSILKGYVCAPQKTRSIIEGTLTTLAVLRYKADRGALPDTLDELVTAGYMKEVLLDRHTGQPFIYRKTADGFTLYSRGEVSDDGRGWRRRITFWPVEGYYRGYSTARPGVYGASPFGQDPPIDPNE
jgi:hypothetical protein